jgi:hypothetical protein
MYMMHGSKALQIDYRTMAEDRNNAKQICSAVYHDYSNVTEDIANGSRADGETKAAGENSKYSPKKGTHFPAKLHYMLSEMEKEGLEHIISWQPHGRCFIVHDSHSLETHALPMYVFPHRRCACRMPCRRLPGHAIVTTRSTHL